MKMLALQGILLVAVVEMVALMTDQRAALSWVVAVAVAVPLIGVLRLLTGDSTDGTAQPAPADEPGDALRRWLSGTEARIRWSESTRADWDRHWRPILARRYEVSTGQRRAKDPAAYQTTGALLFGEALWPWVDPGNVAPSGRGEAGPGRAVLEEILCRLEQR